MEKDSDLQCVKRIKPNEEDYNVLEKNSNGDIIDTFTVKGIDELAGILAVGMSDVLPEGNYLESDVDVSEYRISAEIGNKDIALASYNVIKKGEYGIWILHGREYSYSLYRFTNHRFRRGVISMCLRHNRDFRDLIHKFIFDHYGNTFVLYGYDMLYNPYSSVVPDMPENSDSEDEIEFGPNGNIYDFE